MGHTELDTRAHSPEAGRGVMERMKVGAHAYSKQFRFQMFSRQGRVSGVE